MCPVKLLSMKQNIFTLSTVIWIMSVLFRVEVRGMDAVEEERLFTDVNVFKHAVSHANLITQPLQRHSYDLSWGEFKRAEQRVCESGRGSAKDWITLGLVYRFGLPNHQIVSVLSEARALLIKTAYEDRDISAMYHVICMVIDGEIEKHQEKIASIMQRAKNLALEGNADFLTLMLERDHQLQHSILTKHEYKTGLKRIVSTHPNARAYIALAENTDAERFTATVLGYYQSALAIEPDNITALLGAGGVIDNGLRNGVVFMEGTPTAEYYFNRAYQLNKQEAGNHYGCNLYERAAVLSDVNEARKLFKQAEQILEEVATVNCDALLSLADYHAVEHPGKLANPGISFYYIKQRYLKHQDADLVAALEVLRNLKATMETLERSGSNLFRKIQNLEISINESLAS